MNAEIQPTKCPKCGAEIDYDDADSIRFRCGNYAYKSPLEVIGEPTLHCRRVAELQQQLAEEKERHKSVCDSVRGVRHAWYCTIQLADCACNCGMQLAAVTADRSLIRSQLTETAEALGRMILLKDAAEQQLAAAVAAETKRCAEVAFAVGTELSEQAEQEDDDGESELSEHDSDRAETAFYVGRRIMGSEQ